MLPIYLIFNTKYDLDILNCYDNFNSAKVNWEKIKSLLNSAVKICDNEDIFWEEKTSDAFYNKVDNIKNSLIELECKNIQILNNIKINNFIKQTSVNFYDKNVKAFVLYKKLKIKYDFYYVPLNIYNAIETQINIIKNVQILELLGCNKIDITTESNTYNKNNYIGSINTGIVNGSLNLQNNNNLTKKENRDTSYEFLERIFSSEDELISYINYQTHIFMDEKDYNSDIELKYLIRARLRSYLQSYSKTFYIKKLSSLEIKIQNKMNKLYNDFNLDFSFNNQLFEENSIKLDAGFFSLDNISTINNIPINSIGFQIILKKYKFKKSKNYSLLTKEIGRFYEKYLNKKYDLLIRNNNYKISFIKLHSELLLNNNIYSNLIKIIENYNDIIYNYEIIRYSYQFAPLNENGFEKMLYSSFYKITNYDDNNYKSIKFIYIFEFLKRFLLFNNHIIDIEPFIKNNNIDLVKVKNFDEILEIAYKIILDPNNTPLDKNIIPVIIKIYVYQNQQNNICLLLKRFIKKNIKNYDPDCDLFLDNYIESEISIFSNCDFNNLNFHITSFQDKFNKLFIKYLGQKKYEKLFTIADFIKYLEFNKYLSIKPSNIKINSDNLIEI